MNSLVAEHTVTPSSLHPFAQMGDVERELIAQFERTPTAQLCAALGNIAVRRNHYATARTRYEQAVALDPAFAEAHLAAAELAYIGRDEEAARNHLSRALRLQRYYPDPSPAARNARIVMLLRDATSTENAPLELLLDRSVIAIDKCFVDGYAGALAEAAVPITAFGWWSDAQATVRAASPFHPLNEPTRLVRASRAELPRSLRGVANVDAVAAHRVAASDVSSITLPAVIRPADTHAGRGLALIATDRELNQHAARFSAQQYDVAPFVDYRSEDGYFRKYRIVIVDGFAYPYHLAISPRWIVHYQSSPMDEHAWMREEEERFLREPQSVFVHWQTSTNAIASALCLDYVGLDVTCLSDGTMLVFEADPAMLIHDEDPDGPFAYKRPFVARIRDALVRRLRTS